VAFSLAPSTVQLPLTNEPMRGLADISYSVYLIHFAVIWFAISQLSLPLGGTFSSALIWTAIVLPVSLVYAYFSARLLERPVRRWANRFRHRGPRPALPALAPAAPVVAPAGEGPHGAGSAPPSKGKA
jgi:peptidoglycan/LPS O-acetylase OafA/YrhL